ncbi:MAG: hypothetical protein CR988_07870 [Treponema sp.]|nr:MAG: hypothetical protein CR988_07870 [Treponema sp.]
MKKYLFYLIYVFILIVEFARYIFLIRYTASDNLISLNATVILILPVLLIFMIICNESEFNKNFLVLIIIKVLYIISTARFLVLLLQDKISSQGEHILWLVIAMLIFDITTGVFYYFREKTLCKLYR